MKRCICETCLSFLTFDRLTLDLRYVLRGSPLRCFGRQAYCDGRFRDVICLSVRTFVCSSVRLSHSRTLLSSVRQNETIRLNTAPDGAVFCRTQMRCPLAVTYVSLYYTMVFSNWNIYYYYNCRQHQQHCHRHIASFSSSAKARREDSGSEPTGTICIARCGQTGT